MHTSKALILVVLISTALGMLASPEPLLVGLAGAVMILGVVLLWRRSDVPLLLLPFGLQWLSVSLKVIQSAVTGAPINSFAEFGGDIRSAAYFALIALAALAVGLRIGCGRMRVNRRALLAAEVVRWPEKQVLYASIGAIIVGHVLDAFAFSLGPARQVAVGLGGVGLAGVFLLTYWCVARRRSLRILGIVMLAEIVFGFTGFFSGFLGPLLVMAIAATTARPWITFKAFAVATLAAAVLLITAVFWSAIKPGYRHFLNAGTGAQVVLQPIESRLNYLANAVSEFDREQFAEGFDALIKRQSYIDFLSHTLQYVPSSLPHEHGARLMETAVHIVTPRILFPNKPPLPSDTVVTKHYTGLAINDQTYTSISIGYLGELYIDFGKIGAIITTLLLGIGAGRLYTLVATLKSTPLLLNISLAATSIIPLMFFETALIKIIGGTLTITGGTLLVQRFAPIFMLKIRPLPRNGRRAQPSRIGDQPPLERKPVLV